MIIETEQIFIDTSHGTQLNPMGPVIVHYIKSKGPFMHFTDHIHVYVQNIYARHIQG
jgi:hypothetical protein